MEINSEDKRKLNRQRPTTVIVVYDRTNQQEVGLLIDLTAQGLRIRGKVQLDSGYFYQLRLQFESQVNSRNDFNFGATCVWSDIIPGTDECDSGFIIDDLSPTEFKLFEDLLKSLFLRTWKTSRYNY